MGYPFDCPNFSGYRPCPRGCPPDTCLREEEWPTLRVLLINLDSLGHVLKTTALLQAVRRLSDRVHLTWLTRPEAFPLVEQNPLVDRLIPLTWEETEALLGQEFDLLLNLDKSRVAGSLAERLPARERRGFGLHPSGAIRPLNPEAEYAFRLGLDDELKFRRNQKTEVEVAAELLALDYRGEEYLLPLTEAQRADAQAFRAAQGISPGEPVVGINTGCADLYPNKKLSVEQHIAAIDRVTDRLPDLPVFLLGGRPETERNRAIAAGVRGRAVETPTEDGLRRGIAMVEACDIILSGDTLGLHLGVALGKQVVGYFGVTCPQEVALFGRGERLYVEDLFCRPCWKRDCPYNLECLSGLSPDRFCDAVERRLAALEQPA